MTEVIHLQKDGSVIGIQIPYWNLYCIMPWYLLCCFWWWVNKSNTAAKLFHRCQANYLGVGSICKSGGNEKIQAKGSRFLLRRSKHSRRTVSNLAMDSHSTISESILHWSFDFTKSCSLVCKMIVCYKPLRFALQSKWHNTRCLHRV